MNGKLSIETVEAHTEVAIEGRMQDILFNWTALTHCISRKLNIPPIVLAASLPTFLKEYEKTLSDSFEIDLAAMRKQQKGGGQQ